MTRIAFWTAASAICFLWHSTSLAAIVRTYSFTNDAPAYNFSCGECSGIYWIRAEVHGTFTVSLDYENGVGSLLALDAQLINAEGNLGSDVWRPMVWQQEFLGPERYYDWYRPPFPGVLQPAEYRPLGPASLTAEHWTSYLGMPVSQIPESIAYWLSLGVGFEPAPANSWILSFDGMLPSPDGMSVRGVASYNVYIEGDEAFLSYYVPIMDAVPSIGAARATLIPEPAGLSILWPVLTLLANGQRRNGRTTIRSCR